tara:strand:- start:1664 stop:1855 length:192 start_codon:yes stop_codon:yes gene_type:complete
MKNKNTRLTIADVMRKAAREQSDSSPQKREDSLEILSRILPQVIEDGMSANRAQVVQFPSRKL